MGHHLSLGRRQCLVSFLGEKEKGTYACFRAGGHGIAGEESLDGVEQRESRHNHPVFCSGRFCWARVLLHSLVFGSGLLRSVLSCSLICCVLPCCSLPLRLVPLHSNLFQSIMVCSMAFYTPLVCCVAPLCVLLVFWSGL